MEDDTYQLNLLSEEIRPNPEGPDDTVRRAWASIDRLGLNDPMMQEMRARHYQERDAGEVSEAYFKRHSPFVWYEARRQGLL